MLAPDQPRRTVFVTARYPPFVGGTEIHTAEVAKRMLHAGHDVSVLTCDTSASAPWSDVRDGVPVRLIPAAPKRSDFYVAPSLRAELRALDPHLVHVQGYHTLFGPMAMWAAQRLGVPHVVTFHSGGHSSRVRNTLRPLHQRALRPLFRRADALVAVSEFERELFAERTGIPANRIHMIPSGATLGVVAPKVTTDRTIITSLGRLERYKGHQEMIRALPHLLQRRPDVVLRLIGTGSYERRLRRLVAKLGVGANVEFTSVPSGDREGLATLLAESSLVTLLSEYESQGLAAHEALALDVPLLVLQSTALSELARNDLAAAIPPGATPTELANLVDQQLRAPLVPPADDRRPLPGWDHTVDGLLDLYERIVPTSPRSETPDASSHTDNPRKGSSS